MGTPELAGLLDYASDLAVRAGEITKRYFATRLAVETKADRSPVTVADRETELFCRRELERDFPGHGIIGEEFGASPGPEREWQWVIDPIDGTKSFVAGIPLYTVLVALLHRGQPRLGVIHQPILNETVAAAEGLGCRYNGEACRVRADRSLDEALLLCTDPSNLLRLHPEGGARLLRRAALSRSWGDGYGYLMLASGRADLMVDPELSFWDIACLKPIIEEAGGRFSDVAGRGGLGDSCLAASPALHAEALACLGASATAGTS